LSIAAPPRPPPRPPPPPAIGTHATRDANAAPHRQAPRPGRAFCICVRCSRWSANTRSTARSLPNGQGSPAAPNCSLGRLFSAQTLRGPPKPLTPPVPHPILAPFLDKGTPGQSRGRKATGPRFLRDAVWLTPRRTPRSPSYRKVRLAIRVFGAAKPSRTHHVCVRRCGAWHCSGMEGGSNSCTTTRGDQPGRSGFGSHDGVDSGCSWSWLGAGR
jgi:hypothetical protein